MLIFSLDPQSRFAAGLAADLDTQVAAHEDRAFEDGEHKLRPLVDPRGADVYVVASLHGGPDASPHDKLCRLLFFVATLRDHGARRVTAVVPYLAYARKERRTKPFDPVTLRYVAQLLEAAGIQQLIVLEPHDPGAFQNALRIPALNLEVHPAFDPLVDGLAPQGPLAVASPDPGGVKRSQRWQEALAQRLARPIGFAMVDKRRSDDRVSGRFVAGEVEGATVLLLDDLIASGETMQLAALALRAAGAREVIAFAAHGLFTGAAAERLGDAAIGRVVVSDSVPPTRLAAGTRAADELQVVSTVPLFARALRDSHAAWLR